MQIPDDVAKKIVEMIDAGEPMKFAADATGVPITMIEESLTIWQAQFGSTKYDRAREALALAENSFTAIEKARKARDAGDTDGIYEALQPDIAMEECRMALTDPDSRVRTANINSALNRSGKQARQQIDVYSHVDRMTRDELIAAAQGMLAKNPDLALTDGSRSELSPHDEGGATTALDSADEIIEAELAPVLEDDA